MVQKGNSKKEVDDLALNLFKQIGLNEDEIESTIELVNLLESAPKSTQKAESVSELAEDITESQQIEQLKGLIEEQRNKLIKYENIIGPNLILMIKSYLDKLILVNEKVQDKEYEINRLEARIARLKGALEKIKAIWLGSRV